MFRTTTPYLCATDRLTDDEAGQFLKISPAPFVFPRLLAGVHSCLPDSSCPPVRCTFDGCVRASFAAPQHRNPAASSGSQVTKSIPTPNYVDGRVAGRQLMLCMWVGSSPLE